MILIATENLKKNFGTEYEKVSFTKGNGYKYLPFDSNDNMHQLIGECGMVIFNNEEFYKYFKTPEQWNNKK